MSAYDEYESRIRLVWAAQDALNKLKAELTRPLSHAHNPAMTRPDFDRWIGELKKLQGVVHAALQDAGLEARCAHVDKALSEVLAVNPDDSTVTLSIFETWTAWDESRKQWFGRLRQLAEAGGEVITAQARSLEKQRFELQAKQNKAVDAENKARQAARAAEADAAAARESAPLSDFLIPLQLDFTLLGGHGFEDLVYAHIDNLKEFESVEHYGACGSDGGRDIWATTAAGASTCFLIANRPSMGLTKIVSDLDSLAKGEKGLPDNVRVVTSKRNVSAAIRDGAKEHGAKVGLTTDVVVWSGNEFEMMLRNHSGGLVARTFGHRRQA